MSVRLMSALRDRILLSSGWGVEPGNEGSAWGVETGIEASGCGMETGNEASS